MKSFWFVFYNIFAFPFLFLASLVLSIFKTKIRQGLAGKKKSLKIVTESNLKLSKETKVILFHCASLGEYEQIKPILKSLSNKNIKRVVSFFSPSGFENMGENGDVDLKLYLPIDSLTSISKFLNGLQPNLIVISKHDIWPNFIWSLQSRKIPVLLVNGTMPADSFMTKPIIRHFYRHVFSSLNFIAPASEADRVGFLKIVKEQVQMEVLGDTRYDQVLVRSLETSKKNLLPRKFFNDKITIIAGSTWPSDEEHLFPAFVKLLKKYDNLFLIIVPHEPTKEHVEQIESYFEKYDSPPTCFSHNNFDRHLNKVLIIDKIGILANLYGFSQIAYVGGSFVPGVHNVMEPAAFHLPILFGPKIFNSPEALELVRREAGFRVENSDEVYSILEKLYLESKHREAAGNRSFELVNENRGATEKILQKIQSYL
jgi:3-deoxy-D-manno-octulosonic-acid transferase